MFFGPCMSVKEVALAPLPEMLVDGTVGLVSLDRERFIRRLLTRRRFCEPDGGSSPPEIERRSVAYLSTVQYRAGVFNNQDTSSVTSFPRRSQHCQATYS